MRRRLGVAGAALALLLAAAPARAQQTHILVVAGLGGTPEYSTRFLQWATELADAAVKRLGVPSGNVVLLTEDPSADPRIHARSTLDNVKAAAAEMAGRAGPDDRVVVVLIGHGSEREDDARFNLPGPDLTPKDLGAILDGFAPRRVALVDAASASGDFIPDLSAPGRTLLTATRNGRERNETRFGGYFVEALAQDGADLDKDGRVSLLEAFTYAKREVERHYQEEKVIQTEHALLDDNGDGKGSEEPAADGADGSLAAAFFVGGRVGTTAAAAEAARAAQDADPELKRLLSERDALQERLARLRAGKDTLATPAYEKALQDLLVELALKDKAIRERQGGGGG